MSHLLYQSNSRIKKAGLVLLGAAGLFLIALAIVPVSGAWFSDTKTGSVTVTSGALKLGIGEYGSLDTTFSGLIPGQERQKTYTLTNEGTITGVATLRMEAASVGNGTTANMRLLHYAVDGGANSSALDANGGSVDLGTLSPGESETVTIRALLDSAADREWQNIAVTSQASITLAQLH